MQGKGKGKGKGKGRASALHLPHSCLERCMPDGAPVPSSPRLGNTSYLMMETEEVDTEEAAAVALGELDPLAPHLPASAPGSSGNGSSGAARRPRRPTWRIVPGTSTESMALDVARRCRLPPEVVARAEELYGQLQPMAPVPAAGSDAASQQQQQGAFGGVAAVGGTAQGCAARAALAPAASQRSLADAEAVLRAVAQDTLAQAGAGMPDLRVELLPQRHAPGPGTTGKAGVYVLRRPDGHFYAGSSKDLRDRLQQHKQVGCRRGVARGSCEAPRTR